MKDGTGRAESTSTHPDMVGGSGLAFLPPDAGAPAMEPAALATVANLLREARQPMLLVRRDSDAVFYNAFYNSAFAAAVDVDAGLGLQAILLPPIVRAMSGEALRLTELALPGPGGENAAATRCALSLTPVRDAAGAVAGAFATIEPLPQPPPPPKDSDSELLETIIDSIPVMITLYDPDLNVLRLNRAFERLTGWTTADVARRPMLEMCFPDPAYREEVRQFMAACEGWKDIRMRARSGAMIETSWANVRLADGRQVGIGLDISERRRAEQDLRNSEEMRRLALEGASFGTWDTNLITGETYWDARTREIFGLGLDELATVGRGLALIHPDDRERAERAFREAVAPGASGAYAVEKRIVRPNGTSRWVAANGRVLFSPEGGQPVRMVGVIRDITRRKRADEALRASEERLRVAVASLPIVVWQQDADFRYSWIQNPRLGLDQGILGRTDEQILPASEVAKVEPLKRRVLETGEGVRTEIEVTIGEASEIYEFALEPIIDADGAVVGLTGAAHEVTELRRTARSLAASEARFRTITEAMPQMVWSTRPDGHHDFFNARWYEFTGVPVGATDGLAWRNLFHPDDREPMWEKWTHCLETGEPYESRYRLRHHSGEYRWVLGRAAPLYDEAGRIVRWMGTCTDIHDMQKAEEHRKLLIGELNHRVKNTLAIVQSIAQQTFRPGLLSETACAAFEGRLAALAVAHNLLTREHWEKAALQTVATEALQARGLNRGRIRLAGPLVVLQPKQAVTIAMALHELCTNAVKYGALSNQTGTVTLSWDIECGSPSRLSMLWREAGGPPVEPPGRRGFGSRLIERALAYELDGEVNLDYRSDGVVCEIIALLDGPGEMIHGRTSGQTHSVSGG